MNKCMISQPMKGLTDEEILAVREKAIAEIENMGYEFKNSYFSDFSIISVNEINIPVLYLSKSIEIMAECKAVYFCKGWDSARGCTIEHEIAKKYGLVCIYE